MNDEFGAMTDERRNGSKASTATRIPRCNEREFDLDRSAVQSGWHLVTVVNEFVLVHESEGSEAQTKGFAFELDQ